MQALLGRLIPIFGYHEDLRLIYFPVFFLRCSNPSARYVWGDLLQNLGVWVTNHTRCSIIPSQKPDPPSLHNRASTILTGPSHH